VQKYAEVEVAAKIVDVARMQHSAHSKQRCIALLILVVRLLVMLSSRDIAAMATAAIASSSADADAGDDAADLNYESLPFCCASC
jgi:hypothetical protein